jgi:RNA polymerase sigma-70 factor, ECF subfamily
MALQPLGGHELGVSTDEVLLAAADDPDAFGELYQRHAPAVLGYFYGRTGCAETAADLTAETFAAAFTSRRRFEDIGAPAFAWIVTIAKRQLSHFIRHEKVADKYRRRVGVGPLAVSAEDLDRVEALSDLGSLRSQLADALAALPSMQAQALQLRVVDQQPYAEVARGLGVTEGAARVMVSRGLTKLADVLEAP